MFGIDRTMPNNLKKRRVVYIDDNSWGFVLMLSNNENKSVSEVLREIIKGVSAHNKLYYIIKN